MVGPCVHLTVLKAQHPAQHEEPGGTVLPEQAQGLALGLWSFLPSGAQVGIWSSWEVSRGWGLNLMIPFRGGAFQEGLGLAKTINPHVWILEALQEERDWKIYMYVLSFIMWYPSQTWHTANKRAITRRGNSALHLQSPQAKTNLLSF